MKFLVFSELLNKDAMLKLCPEAELLGSGYIKDHSLLFRKGMDGQAIASIMRESNKITPAAMWDIKIRDMKILQDYHGFLINTLLSDSAITLANGRVEIGSAFEMNPQSEIVLPEKKTIDLILQGYSDLGLDQSIFHSVITCISEILENQELKKGTQNLDM